ncbi:protein of unknown function [Serratia sp. Tan611]|nr:protein of unknown function [Serratia sp. Tan611]
MGRLYSLWFTPHCAGSLAGGYTTSNERTRKIMFEINPVKNRIQDLSERTAVLRGYL